jgi:8-oxo-dGTP pyrophosphatase MutT (NUDIX family)
MYKVFINNKAIYIVNAVDQEYIAKDILIQKYHSDKSLKSVIADFQKSYVYNIMILYDKNINYLFEKIISLYKVINAAGGLVRNQNGDILFIYRYGKWDLPKGKIEKNEKIQDTALREVEEECGISGLTIISQLKPTFHIYNLNGKDVIKKSYWFEMRSDDCTTPIPQLNEGINDAKWICIKDLEKVMTNTYLSVKDLVTGYLENQ